MKIVSNIEIKLKFPYVVMLLRHIMSIAKELIPIYNNTTVHKNKSTFAFSVGVMMRHKNATRAVSVL